MSITYNFEVASVDEQARCMEVIYSADGHETMRIGARLPYEGETLEAVIRMYEPVNFWLEKQMTVVAPSVGQSGTLAPLPFVEQTPAQDQPVVEGAQTL